MCLHTRIKRIKSVANSYDVTGINTNITEPIIAPNGINSEVGSTPVNGLISVNMDSTGYLTDLNVSENVSKGINDSKHGSKADQDTSNQSSVSPQMMSGNADDSVDTGSPHSSSSKTSIMHNPMSHIRKMWVKDAGTRTWKVDVMCLSTQKLCSLKRPPSDWSKIDPYSSLEEEISDSNIESKNLNSKEHPPLPGNTYQLRERKPKPVLGERCDRPS